MPGFDKTGPAGKGPKTGRGLGPCAGSSDKQNLGMDRGMGMGRGRGFDRGRGFGCWFGWGLLKSKTDKLQVLTDYKKALEEELKDIKKEEEKLSK